MPPPIPPTTAEYKILGKLVEKGFVILAIYTAMTIIIPASKMPDGENFLETTTIFLIFRRIHQAIKL